MSATPPAHLQQIIALGSDLSNDTDTMSSDEMTCLTLKITTGLADKYGVDNDTLHRFGVVKDTSECDKGLITTKGETRYCCKPSSGSWMSYGMSYGAHDDAGAHDGAPCDFECSELP